MKQILANIRGRFQSFIVEVVTIIMGIYVFTHINYLDSPKVTPFPPPPQAREMLGFTDDWWFATLLVLVSIITMIGIIFNSKKLCEYGMMMTSSLYMLIAVEFSLRGIFYQHFNVTWIICIGFEALILTINYRGGGKE